MILGVLQFELLIHDARSIKDKRRVVNSLKDRLHREHLVSVAETGDSDAMSSAVLSVAVVARDGARGGSVLDAICAKVRAVPDAEVAGMTRNLIHEGVIPDLQPEPGPDTRAIDAEMLRHIVDAGEGA